MTSIAQCVLLQFRKIEDPRGALTPIENNRDIPFEIKRVYYLYQIAEGASRAGHSHKELQQVLIAVSGSFDVHVDDGTERRTFHLSDPSEGLYVPRMIWREIDAFSSNAVCIALASMPYEEGDYYRSYDDFLDATRRGT
ncbi:FdtA/QdtA family cupin domain-containing protein [Trinickia sp. EG282A]|uniref:FdtA/QdtA family cupin domain-containing protein n=1 Tax=Trinickia sp. EG282A TaxID=3237013 RepID=UPI0034D358CD